MKSQIVKQDDDKNYPSTYSEVKLDRMTYCVTSVFTGEKELGATLEKLAVQKILDDINQKSQELLKAN